MWRYWFEMASDTKVNPGQANQTDLTASEWRETLVRLVSLQHCFCTQSPPASLNTDVFFQVTLTKSKSFGPCKAYSDLRYETIFLCIISYSSSLPQKIAFILSLDGTVIHFWKCCSIMFVFVSLPLFVCRWTSQFIIIFPRPWLSFLCRRNNVARVQFCNFLVKV